MDVDGREEWTGGTGSAEPGNTRHFGADSPRWSWGAARPLGTSSIAPGVIDFDAPCRGCGYNLRGRRLHDACPECAAPVRIALEEDLLVFSDQRWVTQLARGVRCTLIGMALMGLAGMVAVAAMATLASAAVGGVLLVAAALVRCCGAWLLTTPDPSGLGEAANAAPRKLVRLVVPVGLAGVVTVSVQRVGSGMAWAGAIQSAGVIALLIEHAATLTYIERLCARMPGSPLPDEARLVRWGLALTTIGVVGLWLLLSLVLAAVSSPGTAGQAGVGFGMGVGLVATISGLALLILAILYVLLLLRLGRALGDAARTAKDNWRHAVTPQPAASIAEGARWT